MKSAVRFVFAFLLCLCLAVAPALAATADAAVSVAVAPQDVTDYSVSGHWLSVDPSHSKPVDVFYVYPTSYSKSTDGPDYCAVDNVVMVKGANGAFNRQATAFVTVGNIYAPYYRQADAGYVLSNPDVQAQNEAIRLVPAADCIAAFNFYLDHFNSGRPFILAGHSQGSNILLEILASIRTRPEVLDKMVAAYVIGFSVTQQYLDENPPLKFATGPDDTGVIISYNTEAAGVPSNPVVREGALAINPITWTRGATPALKEQNFGSIKVITAALCDVTPIMGLASAQVDTARGVVVCASVDPAAYALPGWPAGVYHSYDYPFYYYNIRENAQARVDAYLAAHP
jgi:hypothetical protein